MLPNVTALQGFVKDLSTRQRANLLVMLLRTTITVWESRLSKADRLHTSL